MEPVLIHVHVPKCAGTSFRRHLDDSFGDRHVSLYVDQTAFVYTPELLAGTVLNKGPVSAISSHFIREFPPLIRNRPALYITFLREPVRHFLSYLTYFKKHFHNLTEPELLRSLPQEFAQMSLRDISEWILTRDAVIPFHENYQVNFFAERAWSQMSGYARPGSEYAVSRWEPAQFERYRCVRLDLARLILGNFFFVGLVEDTDRGVQHLRGECAKINIQLSDRPLGHENISGDLAGELTWIHPGDRVGSLLLESLREDFALFRWATARYQKAVRGALPPALAWDRKFVKPAMKSGPVYLVAQGMKHLVRDPTKLSECSGTPPEVEPVNEWDLDAVPPGAPLN